MPHEGQAALCANTASESDTLKQGKLPVIKSCHTSPCWEGLLQTPGFLRPPLCICPSPANVPRETAQVQGRLGISEGVSCATNLGETGVLLWGFRGWFGLKHLVFFRILRSHIGASGKRQNTHPMCTYWDRLPCLKPRSWKCQQLYNQDMNVAQSVGTPLSTLISDCPHCTAMQGCSI